MQSRECQYIATLKKEVGSTSPTTAKALESYGLRTDSVVGFNKVECRPILAKEIFCVEPIYTKDLKEDG